MSNVSSASSNCSFILSTCSQKWGPKWLLTSVSPNFQSIQLAPLPGQPTGCALETLKILSPWHGLKPFTKALKIRSALWRSSPNLTWFFSKHVDFRVSLKHSALPRSQPRQFPGVPSCMHCIRPTTKEPENFKKEQKRQSLKALKQPSSCCPPIECFNEAVGLELQGSKKGLKEKKLSRLQNFKNASHCDFD